MRRATESQMRGNDKYAESWLAANGWRRAHKGSALVWTHDRLVRGSEKFLSFGMAIDRQKQWDRRRYSS
jgi:hypothetical protein